ncbi:MAG: hypothetical protein VX498_02315 [Myxococcota bacterium]|nr:hypothetical protein [Myxococcota bacterium]
MAMALSALVGIAALVSFVCWIMILIKMFGDKENGGVGKGIFGLICSLYALIWGWQNHGTHNNKGVMMAWTAAIIFSIVANVLITVMFGASM